MGSSLGFGSTPCDSAPPKRGCALFRLAFAAAPGALPLNLATKSNSLAHSPKGTRSGCTPPKGVAIALPLLVSTRFQVLFHSGHPGSFHLSLTVLVHYRSPRVFSLGEWTPLLPTGLACPVVLKPFDGSRPPFAYGTLTLSGGPSQYPSARRPVSHSLGRVQSPRRRFQPPLRNACTLLHAPGLGSSPFARHYSGNALSSWRY